MIIITMHCYNYPRQFGFKHKTTKREGLEILYKFLYLWQPLYV